MIFIAILAGGMFAVLTVPDVVNYFVNGISRREEDKKSGELFFTDDDLLDDREFGNPLGVKR